MFWSFGPEADASSQYRLRFPAVVLMEQGADITLDARGPIILWDHKWTGPQPPEGVRVMALAERPEADVIVMQRPGLRYWADVIPFLQHWGIKVVVDVDDLFDSIDKRNDANASYSARDHASHNFNWIEEACRRADLVTCTTEALKTRYGFGHGLVLPNLVPESYLAVEGLQKAATAGWAGNVGVHPTDLQVTRGAVGKALADTGWGFHVVGTGNGVSDALELPLEPSTSGYVPFTEYPHRVAEMSLGIVPLVDTPFNRAKSCLKMIEMASVGVPALASWTPDNHRMYQAGVGGIVKHPGQWYRRLCQMMNSREYREDMAGRSREAMAAHTYEKQAGRWAAAWGLEAA